MGIKLKHLKNIVHSLNFLVFTTGLALLVMGIITTTSRNDYNSLLSCPLFHAVAMFLMVTGAITVFVVAGGSVGVVKEIRCLVMSYVWFAVVLCLVEFLAGIFAFTFHATITNELQSEFNDTLLSSYRVDEDKTRSIDALQTRFKCCGSKSYLDWRGSDWIIANGTKHKVPDSCCREVTENCGFSDDQSKIYVKGCMSHLIDFIKQHVLEIGAVGLVAALTQVLAIVISCRVARRIKAKQSRNRRKKENSSQCTGCRMPCCAFL